MGMMFCGRLDRACLPVFVFCVLAALAPTASSEFIQLDGVETNLNGFVLGTSVEPSFNSIQITAGGAIVDASTSRIAGAEDSRSNHALIEGASSRWENQGGFVVGFRGSFNSVTVSNEAGITCAESCVIGDTFSADRNKLWLAGSNTFCHSGDSLIVGREGSFNELIATDGSEVVTVGSALIGDLIAATRNIMELSGNDTTWSVGGDLIIGNEGEFSLLAVHGGAQLSVTNGSLVIGAGMGSRFNRMILSNFPTLVTCRDVVLGDAGFFSQLRVLQSSRIDCTSAIIGSGLSASNSFAVVAGGNAQLRVRGRLMFGSASATSLEIGAGGLVVCSSYGQGENNKLLIALGGTNRNEFGRMEITAEAALAGRLEVSLTNDFSPRKIDRFEVITYGSRQGNFININELSVGNGRTLLADVTDSSVVLRANYRLTGADLIDQYPDSDSLDHLRPAFREKATRLLAAIAAATDSQGGPSVMVHRTYRPPARAYLIHLAAVLAHGKKVDPTAFPQPYLIVPPVTDLGDVDWAHQDGNGNPALDSAKAAAVEMLAREPGKIGKKPPGYLSRFQSGRAIEMSVSWTGALRIRNSNGAEVTIEKGKSNSEKNKHFHSLAATYGVFKVPKAPLLWADTRE